MGRAQAFDPYAASRAGEQVADEAAGRNLAEASLFSFIGVGIASPAIVQMLREASLFDIDFETNQAIRAAIAQGEIPNYTRMTGGSTTLHLLVERDGHTSFERIAARDLQNALETRFSDAQKVSVVKFTSRNTYVLSTIAIAATAAVLERLGMSATYALGYRQPGRRDGYVCSRNFPTPEECVPNSVITRIFDAARPLPMPNSPAAAAVRGAPAAQPAN